MFRDEMLRLVLSHLSIQLESGPASEETIKFFETKRTAQMQSRAVQVFAALAVEAFVNDYAYLRLGEQSFEKLLKWTSTSKKLAFICRGAFGNFDSNAEIVSVMRSLSDRRNELVHPKPEMQARLEDGTVRETTKRLPLCDPNSALAAVRDMERFFELFTQVDLEAAMLLGLPWPTPSENATKICQT
jgi:hypothetical protein